MGTKVLFLDPRELRDEIVLDGFLAPCTSPCRAGNPPSPCIDLSATGIYGRNPNPGHLLCIIDLARRAMSEHRFPRRRRAAYAEAGAGRPDLHHLREQRGCRGDPPLDPQVVDAINSGSTNGHRLIISPRRPPPVHENEEDGHGVGDRSAQAKAAAADQNPRALAGIAISADGGTVVAVDDEEPSSS